MKKRKQSEHKFYLDVHFETEGDSDLRKHWERAGVYTLSGALHQLMHFSTHYNLPLVFYTGGNSYEGYSTTKMI